MKSTEEQQSVEIEHHDIQQLAEEHWNWLAPLLDILGYSQKCLDVMRYLYITAMVHGYKHGTADKA